MRKFIEHIENVMTWWMLIVNAVLYSMVFLIYRKCIETINTTNINTDNAWTIFFNHPGETVGVFFSGVFLNLFEVWLVIVAIASVLCLIAGNYDKSDLAIVIMNGVLAITVLVLNLLFVKIYWAILIVLFIIMVIAYALMSSN